MSSLQTDASCAPGAGRRAPLARVGPWLVLVWPPLLLGAHLVEAVRTGSWPGALLLLGVSAAFAATILLHHRPWSGEPASYGPTAGLLVQAALTASALSRAPDDGTGLAFVLLPLLVIAVGVVYPRRAPVLIGLVTLATLVGGLLAGWPAGLTGWLCVITLLSGLGTFVVHRLAATVAELDRTRRELADAAVAAERLRFSRDLHDLLGHSLSVVVVKAEAIRRFAEADPAAAAQHGADIESLGRSALAEVREAVAGYRDGDLADELSRAAAALRAGGVRPEIEPAPAEVGGAAQEVLGWVVREGVTNVLRHSDARTCRIRLTADPDRAVLQVADDGRPAPAVEPVAGEPTAGAGLTGLAERVRDVGGTFTAGPRETGFVLEAVVPR